MDNVPILAAFSGADIDALLNDDTFLGAERYTSHEHPQAILLAGQPGAGKTELSSMMSLRLGGDAALINGDDYRRYHPNYRELFSQYGSDAVGLISPFSNAVVERMIDEFSNRRFHLVIEGTGRTLEVPSRTSELLSKKGYTVELSVIATRPEISLISTMKRFYKIHESGTIPRATAVSSHDFVVKSLPGNLDTLCRVSAISRISIWSREQTLLFDSGTAICDPSSVLIEYWERPWSDGETQWAKQQIEVLREMERRSHLGQDSVIDEIEQRVAAAIQPQTFSPGLIME